MSSCATGDGHAGPSHQGKHETLPEHAPLHAQPAAQLSQAPVPSVEASSSNGSQPNGAQAQPSANLHQRAQHAPLRGRPGMQQASSSQSSQPQASCQDPDPQGLRSESGESGQESGSAFDPPSGHVPKTAENPGQPESHSSQQAAIPHSTNSARKAGVALEPDQLGSRRSQKQQQGPVARMSREGDRRASGGSEAMPLDASQQAFHSPPVGMPLPVLGRARGNAEAMPQNASAQASASRPAGMQGLPDVEAHLEAAMAAGLAAGLQDGEARLEAASAADVAAGLQNALRHAIRVIAAANPVFVDVGQVRAGCQFLGKQTGCHLHIYLPAAHQKRSLRLLECTFQTPASKSPGNSTYIPCDLTSCSHITASPMQGRPADLQG